MTQAELETRWHRREFLFGAGGISLAALLTSSCSRPVAPQKTGSWAGPDPVLRFPGKVPMRVIDDRPPCLETPWRFYRQDLTPNEAFYVRWHLQTVPTTIDTRTYRLKMGGHVASPLELSLDDLRNMGGQSVVAVNQCSGNSRGLFAPRLSGAQWANGAMGNARWTGVPLRDLLRRAKIKAGAVQVVFDGLDEGPLPSVPDFQKALDADHALAAEPLVAYEMNGKPLPLLNGFPCRLVVPGWYATYWVKALAEITVLAQPFKGYWMTSAYKIPTTLNAVESPDRLGSETVPIHRMNVRSFFTTPDAEASVPVDRPVALDGIAFDGGDGIRSVEISADGGATWELARLGDDLGKFSFRRWRLNWTPKAKGEVRLRVKATSNSGQTQPAEAGWNRGGFMRNVIEELPLTVA